MKFDGICIAKCSGHNCCLVDVELFRGSYPASNLTGRMCPLCGTIYVIDASGEIVVKEILGLRAKFPLYRKGILTGKIAFWEFDSKRFLMSRESLGNYPKGPLQVKLPYLRKGIPSGDVFEAGISLNHRTIDAVMPYRKA